MISSLSSPLCASHLHHVFNARISLYILSIFSIQIIWPWTRTFAATVSNKVCWFARMGSLFSGHAFISCLPEAASGTWNVAFTMHRQPASFYCTSRSQFPSRSPPAQTLGIPRPESSDRLLQVSLLLTPNGSFETLRNLSPPLYATSPAFHTSNPTLPHAPSSAY